MSIDWFTFVAQLVNFLVLVALLRWFLYGPIVRAMKRREEVITSRLEEADRKRAEADDALREYQEKLGEIAERREELLTDARREADEERQCLAREAKQQVGQAREQWHEAFKQERDELLSDFRRQVGEMATEAARRTLQQLADVTLEERMFRVFSNRLRELDDQQREEIVRHLGNGKGDVVIRSTFDMPTKWQQRFRESIRERFGYDADVAFENSTDLICGLELEVAGYTFGWNVDEFLQNLEFEFGDRQRMHR